MEEDISNKTGDISNKTIVVLVILTVLISVLGTLVVFNEVSNTQNQFAKATPKTGSSVGKVNFEIVGPQPAPPIASPSGLVTFEIVPKAK